MTGYENALAAAVQKKIEGFGKKAELLEYPEIQADKGEYTRLLAEYGELKTLSDAYSAWKKTLDERDELVASFERGENRDEELLLYVDEILEELTARIGVLLGKDAVFERVYIVVIPGDQVAAKVEELKRKDK